MCLQVVSRALATLADDALAPLWCQSWQLPCSFTSLRLFAIYSIRTAAICLQGAPCLLHSHTVLLVFRPTVSNPIASGL